MANTASAKSTLGNIFGMVGTTATTVTSLMDTAAVGVGMLDRFAQKHSDNQRTQYDLEAGGFKVNLVKSMAMEAARQNEEVIRFCAESEDNKKGYDEAFTFYSNLLAESETKRLRAGWKDKPKLKHKTMEAGRKRSMKWMIVKSIKAVAWLG